MQQCSSWELQKKKKKGHGQTESKFKEILVHPNVLSTIEGKFDKVLVHPSS